MIELVCALALVVLLSGLVVLSYSGMRQGARLDDGTMEFTVMVRLARADAARFGRRIRLALHEQTGELQVLWEPEPLAEPGKFVPYRRASWARDLPGKQVWVRRMEMTGTSALSLTSGDDLMSSDEREAAEGKAPITFLPDGTSDSARIELIARHPDELEPPALEDPETRIAVVTLEGGSGLITRTVWTLEELDEGLDQEPEEKTDANGDPVEPCEDCDE